MHPEIMAPDIFRLRIELLDIEPPIWRVVELPSKSTFAELHRVIQASMGWQNSHLHEFRLEDACYGVPEPGEDTIDESSVQLQEVLEGKDWAILYLYDFGDDWAHDILVEDVLASEPGVSYPRLVDGGRACPPEDCGGVMGYSNLLTTLSKPRNREYKRLREWVGSDFDPERFSVEEANRQLQQEPGRKRKP